MKREHGSPAGRASTLLVNDDAELGELLEDALGEHGILVELAHDGRRGLARALSGEHDLLLFDVMLPGLDGFELLRQVRRRSDVPVIMLTARVAPADQIAGLEAGADDYLPKPFGTDVLVARIRAVLRRSGRGTAGTDAVEVGRLRVVPGARQVLFGGEPVPLTSVEFDILEYLARAAGRVVPRDELTVALFRRHATPFDRVLVTHVHNIRKKLGPAGDAIVTVRSVGYMLRAGDGPGGPA